MALRPAGPVAARAVTPPTAAVVHRGDVEIYSLAELKKFERVTEIIGTLTISVSGPKVALPNLIRVQGQLNLGSDHELALNKLKTVTEGFTVAGSPTLSRISVPKLETVGSIAVSSASYPLPKLQTLDLPSLTSAGVFSMAASGLRAINAPKLRSVSDLAVHENPQLTSLDLSGLRSVEFRFEVTRNPKVPATALKKLVKQLRDAGVDAAKLIT